jgi:hypothetical protein
VLQEQELAVANTRQPGTKVTSVAALGFGFDGRLVHLPFFAVGWIGKEIVKASIRMLIVRERATILAYFVLARGRTVRSTKVFYHRFSPSALPGHGKNIIPMTAHPAVPSLPVTPPPSSTA